MQGDKKNIPAFFYNSNVKSKLNIKEAIFFYSASVVVILVVYLRLSNWTKGCFLIT